MIIIFQCSIDRFSNEELSTFTGAFQMIVDANDDGTDIATHGDYAGSLPFGIYFTGDNNGATTTIGSGLVKVWHTGHFKKAHIDYFVGLYNTGVTTTEYDYLDGVTSNIQTQLDAKQATLTSSTAISVGNVVATGTHTFTADDTDFVIKDTTDSTTNFIWRDHSASKLYLGTSAAVVTTRSHVLPHTSGTADLGSSTVKYRNLHLSGTISSDAITSSGQITSLTNINADLLIA